MKPVNMLAALLLTAFTFFLVPDTQAQCMGMNPKNCIRLNAAPRGEAQYHKSQKQTKQRVWVEGRWLYSRRGARWVPGRWIAA